MRNNPWFPLVALLVFGAAGYALIVTVGCGAVRTALDEENNAAEETATRSDIWQGPPFVLSVEVARGPEDYADGFSFPDDRAGQLLSKLLFPSEKSSPT